MTDALSCLVTAAFRTGLEHYQKLLKAGVTCYSRVVVGTVHAGDCLFPGPMPEVQDATLRDIKSFADDL